MSRKDQLTGRRAMFGQNRSKALNATPKIFKLNLQKATIMHNGKKKKVLVSTKTLRTLRKKGLLV